MTKKLPAKTATGKQREDAAKADDEWSRVHAFAAEIGTEFGSDIGASTRLADDLSYWREHGSKASREHEADEALVFDPGGIALGARAERFVDDYKRYASALEAEKLAEEIATATNEAFARVAASPDSFPVVLQAMRRALRELLSVGEIGMPMRYGDGRLRTEWALCWIESAAKAAFLMVRRADTIADNPVQLGPTEAITRVCAWCCINIANGGDDLGALGPLQEPVPALLDHTKGGAFIVSFRDAVAMRLMHEVTPQPRAARALCFSEVNMPEWPGDSAFSALLKRHDDGEESRAFSHAVTQLSMALAQHTLAAAKRSLEPVPPSNNER